MTITMNLPFLETRADFGAHDQIARPEPPWIEAENDDDQCPHRPYGRIPYGHGARALPTSPSSRANT